jgi:hypothetical protein
MLYPTDFPYESVKIVIEDIRNKTAVTDRQKFAKALWELSGYALKSVVGEPLAGDVPFIFASDAPLTMTSRWQTTYNLPWFLPPSPLT